jgi:hypothetical protein
MRTEELRRELHREALQTEPFTGDLTRARGRVRLRRIALAAAALVIAVAVPVAVVVIRPDHREQVALGEQKVVTLADLPSRDALVLVSTGADTSEVRTTLEGAPEVRAYVVLSPPAASPLTEDGELRGDNNLVIRCYRDGFVVTLADDADDIGALRARLADRATVTDWHAVERGDGFAESILRRAAAAQSNVEPLMPPCARP